MRQPAMHPPLGSPPEDLPQFVGLQSAALQLRAEGAGFAALISAVGRVDLGRRSLLASGLQPLRVMAAPERRREYLQALRAAAADAFHAGARGILVLVSHEAARFFDDFETYPPWADLPPVQLWAAHEVKEFPPGPVCVPPDAAGVAPALPILSSWDPPRHSAALREIQAAIAAGQIYQACLTYPIVTQAPQDTGATFCRWLARQPVDHAAWIHLPGIQAGGAGKCSEFELLCCSPERFFSLKDHEVQVRPMKGTRAIEATMTPAEARAVAEALQAAEKDRAENVMIVDLMRNDLGRVCVPGSVEVRALCAVETYASVAQMTSTIAGQLRDDADVWDVLAACFPPGSMTGAPKIEACKWIRRLESGPRGLYGGAVGWLEPHGDAEFNVVIRSLQMFQGAARWDVGGGIVADSTAEAEWLETRAKAALLAE
jgi:para-aminobenzoate synthetase component I